MIPTLLQAGTHSAVIALRALLHASVYCSCDQYLNFHQNQNDDHLLMIENFDFHLIIKPIHVDSREFQSKFAAADV